MKITLHYLGVSVQKKAYMFGDNKSIVDISTVPHAKLHKHHNVLSLLPQSKGDDCYWNYFFTLMELRTLLTSLASKQWCDIKNINVLALYMASQDGKVA